MRAKILPIVVLVTALVGLAGSGAWAMNREAADGNGWMNSGSTSWGYRNGSGKPVRTIGEARSQAQSFADRLDLRVAEVLQFTNNYYARLDDKSGTPATEVLVDPTTGRTSLEYGPAMMWNTRYGMTSGRLGDGMMGSGDGMMGGPSGGMMGSAGGSSWMPAYGSDEGPVSARQAITIADRWLARRGPSLRVPDADAFPGYYTMEIERHGKIVGMLSVDAASGAIWEHWWHGHFVAISE